MCAVRSLGLIADVTDVSLGVALGMKMNGWRLQWAIHRMLVKRRSVNLPPDYSRALEMWEKDGCPTVV